MKASRIFVGFVLGLFATYLYAYTPDKEFLKKNEEKILWVVDGVALNDSVFGYTLAQLRSDSAAVLASRVLSWVYPNDIASISVIDSVSAAEYGFVNCNGVVKIATTFREPLSVIINGIPNKSKEKVSAGEILGNYNYIQHIIKNEFDDLEDYGINDCVILKEIKVGFHWLRTPCVVVTTEVPYYRADNLVGKYTGKQGRQFYELKLNVDSTYQFSKRNIHKKATHPGINNYGTWSISKGEIILVPSHDPTILRQGYTASFDTAHLKIKTVRNLTLPKGIWNNKKPLTLQRQYEETDR